MYIYIYITVYKNSFFILYKFLNRKYVLEKNDETQIRTLLATIYNY